MKKIYLLSKLATNKLQFHRTPQIGLNALAPPTTPLFYFLRFISQFLSLQLTMGRARTVLFSGRWKSGGTGGDDAVHPEAEAFSKKRDQSQNRYTFGLTKTAKIIL